MSRVVVVVWRGFFTIVKAFWKELENNSLNIYFKPSFHAIPQFHMQHECGWVCGNEEKLISSYDLCKRILCASFNTNVKHFLPCLKVIKSKVINKTFLSKLNNYKCYKPTKWSAKKSLRGCPQVFQHTFSCCTIILESQFEK